MTTNLLVDWFEIAIRHEQAAKDTRGRGDLGRERQEAMVVTAACAHALDGLRWSLAQHLGERRYKKAAKFESRLMDSKMVGEINAALLLALKEKPRRWRAGLADLVLKLRHPTVHPKARANAPVANPRMPTNVSAESALYSVERAIESVDLLSEILAATVTSQKQGRRRSRTRSVRASSSSSPSGRAYPVETRWKQAVANDGESEAAAPR